MEDILAYVRMKLYETEQKSRKYALQVVDTESIQEKHRLEIELSYLLGKASTYLEIEAFIKKNPALKEELRRVIDRIANEVIFDWKMQRLEQVAVLHGDDSTYPEFEAGVEVMKLKLVKILLQPDVDVSILEVPPKEQKENEKSI